VFWLRTGYCVPTTAAPAT